MAVSELLAPLRRTVAQYKQILIYVFDLALVHSEFSLTLWDFRAFAHTPQAAQRLVFSENKRYTFATHQNKDGIVELKAYYA